MTNSSRDLASPFEAADVFSGRMRFGIATPCALVIPYALFVYYGLDQAHGPAASLTALLIALGTPAYYAGALLGDISAALVLCFGSSAWFENQRSARHGSTVAICAFFSAVSLAVRYGHPEFIVLSLAVPAVSSALWLALTTPNSPLHD